MKYRILFILLLTIGLITPVAAAASGDGDSHAGPPEWAALFGDASLPVVWQSATASVTKIAEALAAGKWEGVAEWAETIHLAAHALVDQVKLSDDGGQKRLDGALNHAARLADEVIEGARHNEREDTAAAFRRLQAAVNLARLRLPKEVTEAAAQTPRFVAATGGDAGHQH